MGPRQKKSLSDKDKQFIREMKTYLQMIGIPRDQWSKIIQEELQQQRRSKVMQGILNPQKEGSGIFGEIKAKIGKNINKFSARRMGVDDIAFDKLAEVFNNPFETTSKNEINFFNPFFSNLLSDNIEELGKGGSKFAMEHSEKKRMIVDLDLDDDLEEE